MAVLTPTVLERLRALAASFTKDHGAAEVLVEDSIVKFAETVDPDRIRSGKVLPYLRMMIRNRALSWLRHAKTQREYLDRCHEAPIRSAFAEAISKEAMELFDDVVSKLPKGWKRVVILRVIDQLTFDEIAKKMRIKVGTALSRFWRAKQQIGRWVKYMQAES